MCFIHDLKYFIASLLYISPVSENVKMYTHITASNLNQTTYKKINLFGSTAANQPKLLDPVNYLDST